MLDVGRGGGDLSGATGEAADRVKSGWPSGRSGLAGRASKGRTGREGESPRTCCAATEAESFSAVASVSSPALSSPAELLADAAAAAFARLRSAMKAAARALASPRGVLGLPLLGEAESAGDAALIDGGTELAAATRSRGRRAGLSTVKAGSVAALEATSREESGEMASRWRGEPCGRAATAG